MVLPGIFCQDAHDAPMPGKRLLERQKLLGGPLQDIRVQTRLAASLLLPNIGSRLLMEEKKLFPAPILGKFIVSPEEIQNTLEKQNQWKGDHQITLSGTQINLALMVLSSGIAIREDGKELSYTPTPEINRRLDGDRIKAMQETGMITTFSKEVQGETHNQPFSLVPFSYNEIGLQLKDLATKEEARFAGNPKTTGMTVLGIQKLWRAFVQEKEIPTPIENAMKSERGQLAVFGVLMSKICSHFGQFQTKASLENFLSHLLDCWNEQQNGFSSQNQSKITLNDLDCRSLGDIVLLSKTLWVSLDFPVVCALEGSARLYCANAVLLGVGIAENLQSLFAGTIEQIPTGLCSCSAIVNLYGVEGGLTNQSRIELYKLSLRLQETVSRATPISLRGILPDLCEQLALETDAQKQICSWKNSGYHSRVIGEKQKTPLIQLLTELQKMNAGGFINKLLAGQQCKLLSNLGPHTCNEKNSARVRYFSLVFGLMKIQFVDKNIKCTSPHLALKNFFVSNGNYLNATKEDRCFPWIPQGIPLPNQNDEFNLLLNFKAAVVTPLVTRLKTAFMDRLETNLKKKDSKRNYKVSELFLIEWLYAYIWELVHWGGVCLSVPKAFERLNHVKGILQPQHFVGETEDQNDHIKILDGGDDDHDCSSPLPVPVAPKQQKKNMSISLVAKNLKKAYSMNLVTNLFGVVTFVVQHIANREMLMRGERGNSRSDDSGYSFVELFETPVEDGDFDSCMEKICPLFAVKVNGKDHKLSLFELTKWLFSSDSEEAKKAAEAVNDALERHFDNGDMQKQMLYSFVEGNNLTEETQKIFYALLLPQSELSQLSAGKALAGIKEILAKAPERRSPRSKERVGHNTVVIEDLHDNKRGKVGQKRKIKRKEVGGKRQKRHRTPLVTLAHNSKHNNRPKEKSFVSKAIFEYCEIKDIGECEELQNFRNEAKTKTLEKICAGNQERQRKRKTRNSTNCGVAYCPGESEEDLKHFDLKKAFHNKALFQFGENENITTSLDHGESKLPCNPMSPEMAKILIKHGVVLAEPVNFGATFHHRTESSNKELSFFPFHPDKNSFHSVAFVTLEGEFFTLLGIPNDRDVSAVLDVEKQQEQFERWKEGLEETHRKQIQKFQKSFVHPTFSRHYPDSPENYTIVPFHNKRGSVLRFPAQWPHGTINPACTIGQQGKELLIIHF
jgi:hypothetical protein